MKLYYASGACSMAVHVVLEELGLDYEAQKIELSKGEHKQPAYLKINPRGEVAAMEIEGENCSENAAMIIYLNDKNNGKMIPKDGMPRMKAMQWLMFVNSGLHGAYSKFMFIKRNDESNKALLDAAQKNVQSKWDEIERHLNETGQKFLAGNEVTAADIYATVVANWSFINEMPKFGPKTKELLKAVSSRPTYQKVMEKEQVEYKAAA